MHVVRALPIIKYSATAGRFQSDTFGEINGGVSVFDKECAIGASQTTCAHIATYYGSTVGLPPIFCVIDVDDMLNQPGFENAKVEYTEVSNGDACHMDVTGTTKKGRENFAKRTFIPNSVFKCIDGLSSLATKEELETFREDFLKTL